MSRSSTDFPPLCWDTGSWRTRPTHCGRSTRACGGGPRAMRASDSVTGVGLPKRKPCPYSQCMPESTFASASVSIPSATTGISSSRARKLIVLTILRFVGSVDQRFDEAAVDFQRRDGQRAEIAEARIAGSEVVDRDAHTVVPARLQDATRARRILHQHALGDFKLEALRVDQTSVQDLHHGVGKTGLQQIVARDVDAHEQLHRRRGRDRLFPAVPVSSSIRAGIIRTTSPSIHSVIWTTSPLLSATGDELQPAATARARGDASEPEPRSPRGCDRRA